MPQVSSSCLVGNDNGFLLVNFRNCMATIIFENKKLRTGCAVFGAAWRAYTLLSLVPRIAVIPAFVQAVYCHES